MSLYTKSGDKGETGLLGGKRISKSSTRIRAIGNVDELNAAVGVLRVQKSSKKNDAILRQAQDDIFVIGMELADPARQVSAFIISEKHARFLEEYIDALEKKLPKLTNFILPTGTPFAAHAHLSRAICRRAEQTVVALHEKEPVNQHIIMYLNRLSDLLFMLARENLYDKKVPEIPWKSP